MGTRGISKSILFFMIVVLSVQTILAVTNITDTDSIFGGKVTSTGFYENGTYVQPISTVNWGGDLSGIGTSPIVNVGNFYYAILVDWQNVTNKPTNVSYFVNDAGYVTSAILYQNFSQFLNQTYLIVGDLVWSNISGTPMFVSYFVNDAGYLVAYNATDGDILMYMNGSLIPSEMSRYFNVDEDGLIVFNRTFYVDNTNGVVGVNIPPEESHKASFQVTSKFKTGEGTLTVLSYDSINNQTLVQMNSAVLGSVIDDSTNIYVGSGAYFINEIVPPDQFYLAGNVNFPANSQYSYKIAPYIDVFGASNQERGYSISNNESNWQWSMYIPNNVNNSELCFGNSQFPTANLGCFDTSGNLNIEGVLNSKGLNTHRYAGFITFDTPIDNGDGTLNIPNEQVALYMNPSGNGAIFNYMLSGGTTGASLPAIPQGVSFLVGDYNSGTPIFNIITNRALITQIDVVPYLTIVRSGNRLDILEWDSMGNAMPEKLNDREVRTERFARESGVVIGESAGNVVTITNGKTWHGAVSESHNAFSSSTDTWRFFKHVSGNWTEDDTTTTYNNQYYDDGTNLVALGNGNYTVNWVYRKDSLNATAFYYLGNQQYVSLSDALNSQPLASIPDVMIYTGFLVGRIIVQKNATSASDIGSSWTQEFASQGVSNHNDLANIQGGSAGSYFHLGLSDYQNVVNQGWVGEIANVQAGVDSLNSSKLGITDQRYNDTAFIQSNYALNSSLSNYLLKSGGTMTGAIHTDSIIDYTTNGTVNTYANGCKQIANSTGVYWIC